MQIEFCVPVLVPKAASSAAEVQAAQGLLDQCVKDLRRMDRRVDLSIRGSSATFQLPAVFHVRSSLTENAAALDRLMFCLTELDTDYRLRRPGLVWLYDHPLRYARTVVWDTTAALYARGGGDCKSLTATRMAEYWAAGIPAKCFFRFLPPELNQKYQYQYHLLFLPGAGSKGFECPSKLKGMSPYENSYFIDQPQRKAA